MKLNEFINHIKHNSLSIEIIDYSYITIYDGSIGSYKTSVIKNKIDEKGIFIDNCIIFKIHDTNYKLKINNDDLFLIKEDKESILQTSFKENNITNGAYIIKQYNLIL